MTYDNAKLAMHYHTLAHRLHIQHFYLRQQQGKIERAEMSIAEHYHRSGTLRDLPIKMLSRESKAILEFLLETQPATLDSVKRAELSKDISARMKKTST